MKTKNKNNNNKKNQNKNWRNGIWYFLMGLMLISVISTYFTEPAKSSQINFSEFINEMNQGNIKSVTLIPSEGIINGKTTNGEPFKTFYVDYPELMTEFREQGVNVQINRQNSNWVWGMFIQALLPFILIGALWFFIFRQAQGMNSQAMSFGKSKATPWKNESSEKITFKDVAGVNEAVEELKEIVDYLKNPQRYKSIGAKIPKGALLIGPPGTGKTLLAKAIAGEANVPFFSLSGSDFVEMFVGVGASRVRDLFGQAKKKQPCLIFVDEIDAVGRHRGAGLGGGHDEREQTLNQLLVEMDGFEGKQTVIVIAATNRPDILDPALLRPGRFDRQVTVDKPDLLGREDILKIHAKGKKINKNVDLAVIARGTPGFTGADLANLINEASLLAARESKKEVTMDYIEESLERVLAGPKRKSRVMSEHEKKIIAYHEVGHAIVAARTSKSDPVHKISILPRGKALGYTLQLPLEDKFLMTKEEILNRVEVLVGGRVAEEIIFNEITNGACDDIKRATQLVHSLICEYGMSKKLGTRKYGSSSDQVFLGKSYSNDQKDYSESTASLIDEEIKNIIDKAYENAKKILTKEKEMLHKVSELLLKKEIIEGKEFLSILNNEPTPKAKSTPKAKPTPKAKSTLSKKLKNLTDIDTSSNLGGPAAAPA